MCCYLQIVENDVFAAGLPGGWTSVHPDAVDMPAFQQCWPHAMDCVFASAHRQSLFPSAARLAGWKAASDFTIQWGRRTGPWALSVLTSGFTKLCRVK